MMTINHRRALRAINRRYGSDGGRSERGITFVMFALVIAILLGMVALGIDGGRGFDERRKAQNAADHAALSAAYASCTGGAAVAAGLASAAENGYDDNETTNNVTITLVGAASDHTYEATVWTEIATTFGVVIGIRNLETTTMATARATGCSGGGSGPGAIYAGGTCPTDKYGFESPGSNQRVYGGVHTNSNARVGGGSNHFTEAAPPDDPFTYVGTLASGSIGNGNVYQTDYPEDVGPSLPSPQWPANFAPSVVTGSTSGDPGAGTFLKAYYDLADNNGPTNATDTLFSTKVTQLTKNGVYYTTSTEGMDIGTVLPGVTNVVLVAPRGPIKISASSLTLDPFDEASMPMRGLLMLSHMQKSSSNNNEKKCDEYTVSMSGSTTTWNGIVWATGGLIEFSGSTNSAVNGSMVGWAVRLNGSNITIRYDADLFPVGVPDVLLME